MTDQRSVRPSNLNRLRVCPAAGVESDEAGMLTESNPTKYGTAAHALYAEACTVGREAMNGEAIALVAAKHRCEDVEHLQFLWDLCDFDPLGWTPEEKLSLTIDGKKISGSADLNKIEGTHGTVIDLKFGKYPADHINIKYDLQLMFYGVALMEKYELMSCTIGRLHPYAWEGKDDSIRLPTWEIDQENIGIVRAALTQVIRDARAQYDLPQSKRTYCVNDYGWSSGCKGCSARYTCPANTAALKQVAAIVDVEIPEDAASNDAFLKSVWPMARDFKRVEDVKTELKRLIKQRLEDIDGQVIPLGEGLEIYLKRGSYNKEYPAQRKAKELK